MTLFRERLNHYCFIQWLLIYLFNAQLNVLVKDWRLERGSQSYVLPPWPHPSLSLQQGGTGCDGIGMMTMISYHKALLQGVLGPARTSFLMGKDRSILEALCDDGAVPCWSCFCLSISRPQAALFLGSTLSPESQVLDVWRYSGFCQCCVILMKQTWRDD